MRKLLLALAAVVAVLAPATPAWAHAQLVSADPGKGATLAQAPASVTLTFSEELNPDFTTIVLSDAAQQRLPLSTPVVDAAQATVTVAQPIGNGAYLLAYRVVSQDGHTVQGSYPFTVADPALPTAQVDAAPPVAASDPPDAVGGIPAGVVIGLAALGIVLAGLATWFSIAGRKRRAGRTTQA